MDILERLKIIADTTSSDWPTASIDWEYKEAVKEIERLRAENEVLKAECQWQPIETAPKDGTVVLLHKEGEVFAGWYDYGWCFLDNTELQHDTEISYVEPNAWIIDHGPTQWKPHPAPPTRGE